MEKYNSFFSRFAKGDLFTKLSYLVMGAGCFLRGQVVKGLLFLAMEVGFICYMIRFGWFYIAKLPTLGTSTQTKEFDEALGFSVIKPGDNSMLILLYGVMSILMLIILVVFYIKNTRMAYENQLLAEQGKKPQDLRQDLKDLMDSRFHVTILSVPVVLTFMFTVVPLIFMILMAFTNYDKTHQPPGNLFTWIGFKNFTEVLGQNPLWAKTFIQLLIWTLVWAVFATFLNYILGMLLALVINQKGLKGKKFWRTIFITTMAVPQFVTLMLISKFLADQGAFNNLLLSLGWIKSFIPFLSDAMIAKLTVIVVNIWVGIPYTMLITSGILMNIPEDLYEASRIDGASDAKQFLYITLPYMIQVTTPYLITQFVGNINNFNVIYLLTGGGPKILDLYQAGGTDLLVTWLYKLTTTEQNYALASTIGIFIFFICGSLSLITYNRSKAVREEDQLQ